ncbi:hypothetical protein L6452_06246 [Arctium lappa]|uniref:Uncharacterized protein n=1 Tax=Arctium lappa TaxID=4217 RepID=A0ACB9EJ35_ARCLA|nr:hypothetical protein L6452_06246 [Arctium lappa]
MAKAFQSTDDDFIDYEGLQSPIDEVDPFVIFMDIVKDEQNRKQIVSNGHESVLTSCNKLVLPKLNINHLRGFRLIDSNTYDSSVIDDNNWQCDAHSYFFHDDSRTNKRHHQHAVRQTAGHWLTDLDGKKVYVSKMGEELSGRVTELRTDSTERTSVQCLPQSVSEEKDSLYSEFSDSELMVSIE